MGRKVTLTYELPDDVYDSLEARAAAEGRRLDDLVVEHLAGRQAPAPEPGLKEIDETDRRRGSVRELFGFWDSGDPDP